MAGLRAIGSNVRFVRSAVYAPGRDIPRQRWRVGTSCIRGQPCAITSRSTRTPRREHTYGTRQRNRVRSGRAASLGGLLRHSGFFILNGVCAGCGSAPARGCAGLTMANTSWLTTLFRRYSSRLSLQRGSLCFGSVTAMAVGTPSKLFHNPDALPVAARGQSGKR